MSRSIRSTQSRRIAETFDHPSRGPLVLFAAGALILATLIACNVKGEKRHSDGVVVTKPEETKPQTSDSTTSPSIVDRNVSYATAETTYNQHRYREASDMFGAYVQRKPENPWGHYMLGLSAWKSGQLDVAKTAFERSIELDSTNVKSYLNLGRVLLEQDKPIEAQERVAQAEEIDPLSSEVHRMLGRVQTSLGQPDSAIASYRVALSLDETDVWSMNNMALLLLKQERFEEALPALARAVELKAGSPVFQNNLGVALERTGHFSAASDAYRAALTADSTYVKASRGLSRVIEMVDDPGNGTVDLTVLSQQFVRDVATWKAERGVPAKTTAVKPDSVTVPQR